MTRTNKRLCIVRVQQSHTHTHVCAEHRFTHVHTQQHSPFHATHPHYTTDCRTACMRNLTVERPTHRQTDTKTTGDCLWKVLVVRPRRQHPSHYYIISCTVVQQRPAQSSQTHFPCNGFLARSKRFIAERRRPAGKTELVVHFIFTRYVRSECG